MARLLPSVRGESEATEPTLDVTVEREDSTRRKGLRKAALGLGVLALAYFASRRAGSGEVAPDELWESASDGLIGDDDESMTEFVGREIAGEEDAEDAEEQREDATEDAAGAGDDVESESDTTESGAEPIAETLAGEERSDEEIEERAEENAHEQPAEPGEMHVDEEVVDEVVDGGEESE